jgi:hypothetical protein
MDQKIDAPSDPEVLKSTKSGKTAKKKKTAKGKRKLKGKAGSGGTAKYPRHSVEKALRIPRAIIDQNAGKPCTEKESAKFVGWPAAGSVDTHLR